MCPGSEGIPILGSRQEAADHAAPIPGEFDQFPGSVWSSSAKAQDGGRGSCSYIGAGVLYLASASGPGRVAQVGVEEPDTQEAIVAVVKTQQDAMLDRMSKLVDRLGNLEANEPNPVGNWGAEQTISGRW